MPAVVYKVSFRVSLMREDSPEIDGEVTSLSVGVCFVVSDGQVRDGDFVYDNGQILLELLRGREEEKRRRFVAGLRRLTRGKPATADS